MFSRSVGTESFVNGSQGLVVLKAATGHGGFKWMLHIERTT